MRYATGCDNGKRKEHNEDSIAVEILEDNHRDQTRDAGLFVLADGAGGEDAGDVASYIATTVVVDELRAHLTPLVGHSPTSVGIDLGDAFEPDGDARTLAFQEPDKAELESALETAVLEAHRAIRSYADQSGTRPATTVVAGIYDDGSFHYAWCGDSRAYVLNTETGQFDPLTSDHSEVQEKEDAGVIDETEAMVHRDGNRITNALGASDPMVEHGSVDLYDGDVVMLTSDGLIDAYPHYPALHQEYENTPDEYIDNVETKIENSVVTDGEIRDVLLNALGPGASSEGDLQRAIDLFLTMGNNRGGKDNMSLILFQSETFAERPADVPRRGVNAGADADVDSEEADADEDDAGKAEAGDDDETHDGQTADGASAGDDESIFAFFTNGNDGYETLSRENVTTGSNPEAVAESAATAVVDPVEDEATAHENPTPVRVYDFDDERLYEFDVSAWDSDEDTVETHVEQVGDEETTPRIDSESVEVSVSQSADAESTDTSKIDDEDQMYIPFVPGEVTSQGMDDWIGAPSVEVAAHEAARQYVDPRSDRAEAESNREIIKIYSWESNTLMTYNVAHWDQPDSGDENDAETPPRTDIDRVKTVDGGDKVYLDSEGDYPDGPRTIKERVEDLRELTRAELRESATDDDPDTAPTEETPDDTGETESDDGDDASPDADADVAVDDTEDNQEAVGQADSADETRPDSDHEAESEAVEGDVDEDSATVDEDDSADETTPESGHDDESDVEAEDEASHECPECGVDTLRFDDPTFCPECGANLS